MSEPPSVQASTDNFIADWLAIDSASVSDEIRSQNERAMVNRMVQLLGCYLIRRLLQEMEFSVGSSEHRQASIRTWKAILSGWSTSIESRDLFPSSLKLLKFFVLSEKLTICQEQQQTAQTYNEVAKLLFCISKFTELKDTHEQIMVADLCAEAKSLETLFMIRSQQLCNCNEKWDRRAQVFALNTRKAVVNILKDRMEIPPMFASPMEELAQNLDSIPPVLDHEGSVELAAIQSPAMGQRQSEEREDVMETQSPVIHLDQLHDTVTNKEEQQSSGAVKLEPALVNNDSEVDNNRGMVKKSKIDIVADHHQSATEEEREQLHSLQQAAGQDHCLLPAKEEVANGNVDESINVLQLPFVTETVQWSSDESCDLQLDSVDEVIRSSSYPPLPVTGGGTVDTSTSRLWSSANTSSAAAATTCGGRIKWAEEEVGFLKEGVERFGFGNWKVIRQNYPFHSRRTNVDLKDKWRNLQKK